MSNMTEIQQIKEDVSASSTGTISPKCDVSDQPLMSETAVHNIDAALNDSKSAEDLLPKQETNISPKCDVSDQPLMSQTAVHAYDLLPKQETRNNHLKAQ